MTSRWNGEWTEGVLSDLVAQRVLVEKDDDVIQVITTKIEDGDIKGGPYPEPVLTWLKQEGIS